MTAVAVGPSFAGLPDADKKALIEAFTRMTVANYAKNFDSFSGETFTVDPKSIARGSDKFVKSVMKTKNETIAFNYRTHQAGGEWKVIDIYLAGNISQMAQKAFRLRQHLRLGRRGGPDQAYECADGPDAQLGSSRGWPV